MFQKDSKKVRWVVPEGLSLLTKVAYEMMCWLGCLLIYFFSVIAFWLAEKTDQDWSRDFSDTNLIKVLEKRKKGAFLAQLKLFIFYYLQQLYGHSMEH